MALPRAHCPRCMGKQYHTSTASRGGWEAICRRCLTPMVRSIAWLTPGRCPACNHRYFRWVQGDSRRTLFLFCGCCGRSYSNADANRAYLRLFAGWLLLGLSAFGYERYVYNNALLSGDWKAALAVTFAVLALGLLYCFVLRKLSYCPDRLADRAAAQNFAQKRHPPWDHCVSVKALAEEYRFIQFHPYRCACATPNPRAPDPRALLYHAVAIGIFRFKPYICAVVWPHGAPADQSELEKAPWWRPIIGPDDIVTVPCFRLYDLVLFGCPTCRGCHEYRFDISNLSHVKAGFQRRFKAKPETLIRTHTGLVVRLHEQYRAGGGLDGLVI